MSTREISLLLVLDGKYLLFRISCVVCRFYTDFILPFFEDYHSREFALDVHYSRRSIDLHGIAFVGRALNSEVFAAHCLSFLRTRNCECGLRFFVVYGVGIRLLFLSEFVAMPFTYTLLSPSVSSPISSENESDESIDAVFTFSPFM